MARSHTHVTLGDVAAAAGVSIATASRAINGSTRRVNEEIRQHVRATADRLGYTPNLSAQAVAKGASTTVAVVVGDIADPYFSGISSGIMRAADEAGLVVTLGATERDSTREVDLVRTLRGQRPRAIIIVGSRSRNDPRHPDLEDQLRGFGEAGGRVVLVSQGPSPFDLVELQNEQGAHELAGALIGRGGRRFGIVTGPRVLLTNDDRVRGFRDGLAARGHAIDDDAIVEAEFTRDGGYEATRTLVSRAHEVDTVFVTSDLMALGVMSALRDIGIVPGRDISVAGFDDIPLTRDLTPALTSVVVPLADVGYRAMRLALRERAADEAPTVLRVNTAVVLRESTPQR